MVSIGGIIFRWFKKHKKRVHDEKVEIEKKVERLESERLSQSRLLESLRSSKKKLEQDLESAQPVVLRAPLDSLFFALPLLSCYFYT